MILLRLISLPYLRKHLLRTLLTAAGIVLGVAVFVAMHASNQSVLQAFNKTVDRIAGKTQLQVSTGDAGFSEELLDRVQAVEGVRVAVPVIEAIATSPFQGQGNLLILGVDMTGDRSLRDYDLESGEEAVIDDPLVFLAQPDSLIVTSSYAQTNHLTSGSRITMQTMSGPKTFVVRGIMKSSGLASAYGGNLAIMDVYAAQAVFGRGRTIDRIDLGVKDGEKVETVRDRIEKVVGPSYEVATPAARGSQFESMAKAYSMTGNMTSLFALFIGIFIIFNTFSIAVTQRRNEIGILRALGALRGQIRTLFLLESIVIGILGSIVGVSVGLVMARGLASSVSDMFTEMYGVGAKPEEVTMDPKLIALAATIGILSSVIAAVLPARNASRTDPVKALQKGRAQMISEGENRRRRAIAIFCAVLSVVCLLIPHPAFPYAGYVLAIIAAVLLTPAATAYLARVLRPVLRSVSPVEGALAADSLIQSPRRTSGTVAALMLSLALVIGLAGLAKASYASLKDWTVTTLNPDLFVSPSQSLTARSFRFPAIIGDQLREIDGIEAAHPIRSSRILVDGKPVLLVTGDFDDILKRVETKVVSGNYDDMMGRVPAGQAVNVTEPFANLHHHKVGDILELPAPTGVLRLPIAAVIHDFSDQQGAVFLARKVFTDKWQDDTVSTFRVYLRKGANPDDVKRRILTRFAAQTRLFVLTNKDVKDFIFRVTDQWFSLTYVQIAVAVLVAILGIVNTLTVSITDRRRELGVLQAVGAIRNQIRRTIWIEAIAIAIIGLILGLAFGAIQLFYSVNVTARDFAGFQLEFQYPYAIASLLLPVIAAAAFISAVLPAEAAVRGSLVEALEYE